MPIISPEGGLDESRFAAGEMALAAFFRDGAAALLRDRHDRQRDGGEN